MSDDDWMERAACRYIPDPDPIFFPKTQKGVRTDISAARTICFDVCPVRKHCLVYAVVYRENRGVWGGLSERERKSIPTKVKRHWREVWYKLYPTSDRLREGRRVV
jgi:WhiB family redox-sensing transcriptional regulator